MLNKILVTGGSGFIGSNLIKHLLEKNFTPYSQFEANFREKLLNQYSEKEVKKIFPKWHFYIAGTIDYNKKYSLSEKEFLKLKNIKE